MKKVDKKYNSFSIGILANYAGIAVLAVCGLILNTLISVYYGAIGLGLFSLIMAIYIAISQFSSFGFHYSTLKWGAANSMHKGTRRLILLSGLFVTFISSMVWALISYILSFYLNYIFHNEHLNYAWLLVIPGLILFSLNKILLSYLNSQSKMVIYAILQCIRYISLVMFLILLIRINASEKYLGVIITLAELIVFISAVCCNYQDLRGVKVRLHNYKKLLSWSKKHLSFGFKSFVAGAAIEINSRIDLIILALFVNEITVGMYSLVLFVAEGMLQFVVVIRNSINPLITKYYYNNNMNELSNIISRTCKRFLFLMMLISILTYICFYIYIEFVIVKKEFYKCLFILPILLIGIIASSYYLPLQFFANQINKPMHQSLLNLLFLAINIVLNMILIYLYGAYGAAIATSLSFVLTAAIIRTYYTNILAKIAYKQAL